jgi:DNA-directed RNA polymerase specialized sigma24 family protein
MIAVEDESDYLSAEEAQAQLKACTDADWRRLQSHSRVLSLGVWGMTGDDLLNEASVRLLGGERKWKRGVPGFTTMYKIMQSIARDERDKVKNGPISPYVVVNEGGGADDAEDNFQPQAAAIAIGTPESYLGVKQVFDRLEAMVGTDREAQDVLLCWGCGLYGQEAAAELKMSPSVYDAARKRLDRKITAVKKEGN